jgi:hypothetical protein
MQDRSDTIPVRGGSISPPNTSIHQGLTLFQARNAREDVQIQGNGTFNNYGTFYASNAILKIAGNGAASNIGSQYVSLDLSITGNGHVGILYHGPKVARTRILTLVE